MDGSTENKRRCSDEKIFSHLEEFVNKMESIDTRIIMMKFGRGLTCLANDAEEIGDALGIIQCMTG
jgi:hypothetical protein